LIPSVAISDIVVHEWTQLEDQTKDNGKAPLYWEASFISLDHLITINRFGQVNTFHLKEHYWSHFDVQMTENKTYLTNMSCLIRPGLIVDFQVTQGRHEIGSATSLVLLTWETDQGVLKNFCQNTQELNFPLTGVGKEIYPSAVYSDGTSLYVFAGYYVEGNVRKDSIYEINLETYEVLERKLERESPCRKYNNSHAPGDENRESVFFDGKLYTLAREKEEEGRIGLWVFSFDEMSWEKLQDVPTGRFESYALKGWCHVTLVKDEILIYSIENRAKHLTILSYDLRKNAWSDSFLITNTPKISSFGVEPLLVYQNSFIAINMIENLDLYSRDRETKESASVLSLRIPGEYERSTKERIKTHMEELCGGKTDPDVIFKVADQEFPANRFILSYRSSYFKNAFSS